VTLATLFYGDRVRLGAFRQDDPTIFQRWYQDSDFSRMLDASPARPKSEARLARWLEDEDRNRDAYLFAIRTLDVDAVIGFIQLDGIQWSHGVAWLAIGIGEPDYRGRGYGGEALALALQFAFQEINLHRVQLTVFSYNLRAIRLYEKLGFQREGILREALLRDGARHDVYLYGLLRAEWLQSAPS
jgi:RimJ/RimL family protein N-acetyltransferase